MLKSEDKSMFVPPRGVTGFYSIKDSPPPLTCEKTFHNHCHIVARNIGGKILSFEKAYERHTNNFTMVAIQLAGEDFAILKNVHCAILAIARPIAKQEMTITFLNNTRLADEFERFDNYTILAAEQLAEELTAQNLSELSSAELAQIKYWKPSTIGDVVDPKNWTAQ